MKEGLAPSVSALPESAVRKQEARGSRWSPRSRVRGVIRESSPVEAPGRDPRVGAKGKSHVLSPSVLPPQPFRGDERTCPGDST